TSTEAGDQVRLTREGALFGTPAYMSPEQAKGRGEVDHRSDLWALACIVYECLTGHTVWNVEQGVAMILAQVASSPLPIPSKLRPDLPPLFDQWLAKALQRSPDDRYQTAAQFTIALTDALAPGASGHVQTPSLLVDVDDVLQHVADRRPGSLAPGQGSVPSELLRDGTDNASNPLSSLGTSAAPSRRGTREPAPVQTSVGSIVTSQTDSVIQAERQQSTITTLRKRRNRGVVVLLLITAVMGTGLYFYRTGLPLTFLQHQPASDTATQGQNADAPPLETGGYYDTIGKAQATLLSGNSDEAVRLLDDAIKNGGEGMATNLRGHIRSALETPNAPCTLRAIGRPRPFSVVENASRPTILSTDGTRKAVSSIVAGVGASEDKAKRQVYTTLLDGAMRRVAPAQLVVPESSNARYPEFYQFGDQRLMLYWDAASKEPGIFARYVDETGRMLGGLQKLASLGKDEHDPALVRDSEDRSLWLAWEEDGADGAQNLLLRHFDAQLNPLGGEVALTALRPDRAQRPSALRPAISESRGRLHLAFTLKQGASRRVHSLSIAKNAPELKQGLPVLSSPPASHRFLVPVQALGREGTPSDDARLACVSDTCFTFWSEEATGIVALAHDSQSGEQLWRHEIAPRGARPAVGVDGDQLLVAWYETSRVRVSPINRHGIGTVGTVGKVSGVQPLPDVAKSGTADHWLLAWRDYEAGHLEVITANIECQPRGKP
ncbi:MAG TPA: hypothetical protein VIV60_24705, partial [Polyangiaceae bacterium]